MRLAVAITSSVESANNPRAQTATSISMLVCAPVAGLNSSSRQRSISTQQRTPRASSHTGPSPSRLLLLRRCSTSGIKPPFPSLFKKPHEICLVVWVLQRFLFIEGDSNARPIRRLHISFPHLRNARSEEHTSQLH